MDKHDQRVVQADILRLFTRLADKERLLKVHDRESLERLVKGKLLRYAAAKVGGKTSSPYRVNVGREFLRIVVRWVINEAQFKVKSKALNEFLLFIGKEKTSDEMANMAYRLLTNERTRNDFVKDMERSPMFSGPTLE